MLSNIQKNLILRALNIRKSQGEKPENVVAGYTKLTEEEKQELLNLLQG